MCHKYYISDATFYEWPLKYGGMEVREATRLKAIEDENGKLKPILADTMLDVSTLNGCSEKLRRPGSSRNAVI
jgi:putative transposase